MSAVTVLHFGVSLLNLVVWSDFFYKALPMEGNRTLRIDNNNNNNNRIDAVCPSVCVSIYPIHARKSRTEGHINFIFSDNNDSNNSEFI